MGRPRVKPYNPSRCLVPELEKEAPSKDKPWTDRELESLLDWVLLYGATDRELKKWADFHDRSLVAARRQFQLLIYDDKDSKIYTFRRSIRRVDYRTIMAFCAMDRYIVRMHAKAGVPIIVTAAMLARDVRDVRDYAETLSKGK